MSILDTPSATPRENYDKVSKICEFGQSPISPHFQLINIICKEVGPILDIEIVSSPFNKTKESNEPTIDNATNSYLIMSYDKNLLIFSLDEPFTIFRRIEIGGEGYVKLNQLYYSRKYDLLLFNNNGFLGEIRNLFLNYDNSQHQNNHLTYCALEYEGNHKIYGTYRKNLKELDEDHIVFVSKGMRDIFVYSIPQKKIIDREIFRDGYMGSVRCVYIPKRDEFFQKQTSSKFHYLNNDKRAFIFVGCRHEFRIYEYSQKEENNNNRKLSHFKTLKVNERGYVYSISINKVYSNSKETKKSEFLVSSHLNIGKTSIYLIDFETNETKLLCFVNGFNRGGSCSVTYKDLIISNIRQTPESVCVLKLENNENGIESLERTSFGILDEEKKNLYDQKFRVHMGLFDSNSRITKQNFCHWVDPSRKKYLVTVRKQGKSFFIIWMNMLYKESDISSFNEYVEKDKEERFEYLEKYILEFNNDDDKSSEFIIRMKFLVRSFDMLLWKSFFL